MEVTETKLKSCFIIEPRVFEDQRGYFFESFNEKAFEELTGMNARFVQDNQSFSSYGVVRGLHMQRGEYAQAKLVRVLEGAILDIAVDLRKESETYGQWIAVELTGENKKQLYVPRGFAHGFSVLSKKASVFYKCDNFYHKPSESGILYNDPDLNIDWKVAEESMIISPKDLELSLLRSLAH
jgi:dTDP-4-dehydrorhamnose 3,5-epimerase